MNYGSSFWHGQSVFDACQSKNLDAQTLRLPTQNSPCHWRMGVQASRCPDTRQTVPDRATLYFRQWSALGLPGTCLLPSSLSQKPAQVQIEPVSRLLMPRSRLGADHLQSRGCDTCSDDDCVFRIQDSLPGQVWVKIPKPLASQLTMCRHRAAVSPSLPPVPGMHLH
jgi:hypothetical protein